MAMKLLAVEHMESAFNGYDGTKLYSRSWTLKDAPYRGVVIILHGLKDHSGRYTELADMLAQRGFAVHAFDMRGHGRSEGIKAYVEHFDDLLKDLQIFAGDLRQKYPARPLFIFGHSMGGTTVTLSVARHMIEFQGVVLSAAALIPGESISPALIRVTKLLGNIAPHLPLMDLPNKNFSRDPAVVADMSSDPLIYQKNGPVRTAAELLDAMEQIQSNIEVFRTPVLILHGTADQLTNPAGSKRLAERSSSKDKSLILYPGLVHDLVHEPEKAKVLSDITGWLEARSPVAA